MSFPTSGSNQPFGIPKHFHPFVLEPDNTPEASLGLLNVTSEVKTYRSVRTFRTSFPEAISSCLLRLCEGIKSPFEVLD
jgi:hypothetical protein